MKKCTKCGVEKPLSEYHKKISTKTGFDPWCKPCKSAAYKNWISNNPEKQKVVKKRASIWNAENKNKRKIIVQKNNYKKRYGLTVEQKQQLIDLQNQKCAICENSLKDTHDVCVDHNHQTGAVRGILCRKCNLGLGHFKDSMENLKSAVKYLKKYSGKTA